MNAWKHFPFLLVILFVSIHFESSVNGDTIRVKEKKILNELLGSGRYDPTIVPVGRDEQTKRETPVFVNVNMLVRRIDDFDDVKMQYSPQITFRQKWNDPRLKFDNQSGQIAYLVLSERERIWTPDTFFKNEIQAHFHQMLKPNQLIRIYPNGDVLYATRISLTLSCQLDHKFYPHTLQVCEFQLSSYGFSHDDVIYVWKQEDPVQVNTNLNLLMYKLIAYRTDYCTSKTSTGTYACLRLKLLFKSYQNRFVKTFYLPSTALLIVSWLTFWLHPKATFARVTLIGVCAFLLFCVCTSVQLPPVGYTMLIQNWIGACYTFMFAALIQCALVSSGQIARQDSKENKKDFETNGLVKRAISRISGNANKFDFVSRLIFPFVFVLFCLYYYWKVYSSYHSMLLDESWHEYDYGY